MRIKQKLSECIAPAYYSDGKRSQCIIYNFLNMFDCDSESFKEVKEKRNMENDPQTSEYSFIDRFLAEKAKRESEES